MTPPDQFLREFAVLAGLHLLAVAVPGPDFAMVLRQSLLWDRRTAVLGSLGIALGIFFHSTYCLLGLGVLTTRSSGAFLVVKWLGAAYLAWIGVSTFRSHPTSAREENEHGRRESRPGAWRAIAGGFLTNALNPKAALFFLALFSVVVSPSTPLGVRALYCLWMAVATFLWFACVSCFLAREGVRRSFLKLGPWLGRALGAAFLALAARLALAGL